MLLVGSSHSPKYVDSSLGDKAFCNDHFLPPTHISRQQPQYNPMQKPEHTPSFCLSSGTTVCIAPNSHTRAWPLTVRAPGPDSPEIPVCSQTPPEAQSSWKIADMKRAEGNLAARRNYWISLYLPSAPLFDRSLLIRRREKQKSRGCHARSAVCVSGSTCYS